MLDIRERKRPDVADVWTEEFHGKNNTRTLRVVCLRRAVMSCYDDFQGTIHSSIVQAASNDTAIASTGMTRRVR